MLIRSDFHELERFFVQCHLDVPSECSLLPPPRYYDAKEGDKFNMVLRLRGC